ncbi:hypothetical protein [Gallibacterium anatis]|uniref:hypothetical protein n=1 Tax=Gallibacterium anatis TaxID=750 RepID=UPI000B9FC4F3|nr:hypothetical protein [Gallibacterium anatis]OZN48656.1 hypothetical protein CF595_08840 [Gallibacterium anatis]
MILLGNKIALLLFISAFLGYSISYRSVYLFHVISIIFFFYLLFINGKMKKSIVFSLRPFFILLTFSVFSFFWVKDFSHSIYYIFYLLCGAVSIFSVLFLVNDDSSLKKIINILLFLQLLNIVLGFLEASTDFRYPLSPYSSYVTLFGYKQNELLARLNEIELSDFLSKPTAFNYNPNDFGFVFILVFPFFYFCSSRILKCLVIIILFYFIYAIKSKGLVLSTILFFAMLIVESFSKGNKKKKGLMSLLFLVAGILTFIFFDQQILELLNNRAFSFVDTFNYFIDNVNSSELESLPQDSTGERTFLYLFGLRQLWLSNGFGLGIGGITTELIEIDYSMKSFHFFPLELMIDLGIFFFSFILIYYIRILFRLRKIYKTVQDRDIRAITRAALYSLIIIPIASISPSSTIYILPFWLVFGISLSILRLNRLGKI